MKVVDRKIEILEIPTLQGTQVDHATIALLSDEEDVQVYRFSEPNILQKKPLLFIWKIPAINVKGAWSTNSFLDKHIRADWEEPQVNFSISVDAPVMSLFGHGDENRVTFSCSDLINTIAFDAAIQEENNSIYCNLTFFTDGLTSEGSYEAEIRIGNRANIRFSEAVRDTGLWLDGQIPETTQLAPNHARLPLYSTWYSYHQNFTQSALLNECQESRVFGYELIVLDDGWQTMDDRRGYDFTGDWEAERFPDMAAFVRKVHALDMKIMIWYSVPFCGILSKAYQRFRGMFLTEGHDGAPVFDLRFPELRAYLVSRYFYAIESWGASGFKLVIIDDFRIYGDTEIKELNGRDVLSVNGGVEFLIADIKKALVAINPNVLIELRQKYISSSLRSLGNMFRAFDFPNDSVMNRVRTTGVKLLCGNAAVHFDMFTWHKDEKVEIAALQFISILFWLPQLSVRLEEASDAHRKMNEFYTQYWLSNRSILLDGRFSPMKPLSNYPELRASLEDKLVTEVYDDIICHLDSDFTTVNVVNGKMSEDLILSIPTKNTVSKIKILDCMGQEVPIDITDKSFQIIKLSVPANDMVQLSIS